MTDGVWTSWGSTVQTQGSNTFVGSKEVAEGIARYHNDAIERLRADLREQIAAEIEAEVEAVCLNFHHCQQHPRCLYLRFAAGIARSSRPVVTESGRCCEYHARNCEPPFELCCGDCTEAHHGLHACPGRSGLSHDDGSECIAPDLSRPVVTQDEAQS